MKQPLLSRALRTVARGPRAAGPGVAESALGGCSAQVAEVVGTVIGIAIPQRVSPGCRLAIAIAKAIGADSSDILGLGDLQVTSSTYESAQRK